MHNQPSIAPVRAPVVAVLAQNVTINVPDPSADGGAGVRTAQGRAPPPRIFDLKSSTPKIAIVFFS